MVEKVTYRQAKILLCVWRLTEKNNEVLKNADFRGFRIYEIASLTGWSSNYVRDIAKELLAKGLLNCKKLGQSEYFFVNFEKIGRLNEMNGVELRQFLDKLENQIRGVENYNKMKSLYKNEENI